MLLGPVLQQGRQVHALVTQMGSDRNTFVVGALINMYSKWGNIDEARLVFDSAVYKNNSMDFNDDSLRAESASSPAVPIGTSCWIMVVGYAICN
ncbi:pentatricopeptide repeat-containing protein [Tanacetum coccineum]